MDIASLIASFSTGTYTITRTTRVSNPVRGRIQAGTVTTFDITASVSPFDPMGIQRLPEGRRSIDTLLFFTTTLLYFGGQGDTYEADKISYNGELWEMNKVDDWTDPVSGSKGYRCVAFVSR